MLNPGSARKPLAVRWSKKSRGFFVENLFTVDCEELDDLLAVLEEGIQFNIVETRKYVHQNIITRFFSIKHDCLNLLFS